MSAMPWRVAAAALAGYGLFTAGLFATQRSLIYQTGREAPDLERAAVDGFREVTVATQDGLELVSWYRPAAPGMATLVVTHGNAGHIGHRTTKLAPFAAAGYGLFLVGYRGYGSNPGRPTEQGLYADARAALAWLAANGVPAGELVLYGESLGTGIAVQIAGEAPVAAVVLEAPYTSIADVAAGHYWYIPFAAMMVLDRFDARAAIAAVEAPVLMLHGARDSIIPLRLAEQLHDAAGEPKALWVAPRAGHNDLYEHGAGPVVLEFLATHLNGTAQP